MKTYSAGFAHVYNLRWAGFAQQVAAHIAGFYATTPLVVANQNVLDLCCGTGQLALHFLESGYRVTGIDLSQHMLRYAIDNNRRYIDAGLAQFINADATRFSLNRQFGLVVSTYDSLNHLEDEDALQQCFDCVSAVCDGYFIFDLNTRTGLRHRSGIQIDDSEEMIIIFHRLYDGEEDKAWSRITGFLQTENGLFERFDETAFNTIFSIERVRTMLLETGWKNVHCAHVHDLGTPVADPEKEGRIFLVAGK